MKFKLTTKTNEKTMLLVYCKKKKNKGTDVIWKQKTFNY